MTLIFILLLAFLTLTGISLYKTYHHIALKELKRRAGKGDDLAKLLYRTVGYGPSLRVLLWIIIGLSASGFFVLLDRSTSAGLALFGCALLLWVGFAWLPNSRVTVISEYTAKIFTPVIEFLLRLLQPMFVRLHKWVKQNGRVSVHTGLYQKEDLLDLLKGQKAQLDNRMSEEELRIAKGALTYSDKLVRDVMIPRRVVKMVSAEDSIGPILLAELHESGHSRFPVYSGKQDNIIGMLYMRDIIDAQHGGSVKSYMDKKVFYVNEDKTLGHVLDAFLKTKHNLFMVVNNFEAILGVITVEDILEQIIGKQIVDEFDKFEDLRAVANLSAEKEKA